MSKFRGALQPKAVEKSVAHLKLQVMGIAIDILQPPAGVNERVKEAE